MPSFLLRSADSADGSGFFARDQIADRTGRPSLQGDKGGNSCPFPSLPPLHPLVIVLAWSSGQMKHTGSRQMKHTGYSVISLHLSDLGAECLLMCGLLLPCRIAVLISCSEIPVCLYTSTYTCICTFVCVYLCSLRVS